MNRLGDEFLARAAVAVYVHGRVQLGDARHHIEDRAHFAAARDNVGEIITLVKNLFEPFDFGIELAVLQRALDLQQ